MYKQNFNLVNIFSFLHLHECLHRADCECNGEGNYKSIFGCIHILGAKRALQITFSVRPPVSSVLTAHLPHFPPYLFYVASAGWTWNFWGLWTVGLVERSGKKLAIPYSVHKAESYLFLCFILYMYNVHISYLLVLNIFVFSSTICSLFEFYSLSWTVCSPSTSSFAGSRYSSTSPLTGPWFSSRIL